MNSILEAYETGRGGFRVRARYATEDQGRGTWQIVVTEIPYQVQKARLIEKIAELLTARKLPLLEDVRDESAEDIRLVLVPKSRTVDPSLLMELVYKLTDLEIRFPLNMNVLSRGKVPNVLSLKTALREWLEHRKEVLVRRSRHRLGEIEKRLEILAGYLVAYLNLDEVIRIIREEDEPKQMMMARWSLTDNQAEAILNMRLRALRKLEEFEIRKEFDGLTAEKTQIEALLASEAKQWQTVAWQVQKARRDFGPEQNPELGRRRTTFADAPEHDDTQIHHAMVEKEPITVVVSAKGWLRALRGHLTDSVPPDLQGGRQPQTRLPGPDDRQDPRLYDRGKVLHDRRRPAAGRAGPRRTDPHHRRHGKRPGHCDGVRPRPVAQAATRLARGERFRRAGEGSRRQHAQGQAGHECSAARRGVPLRAGQRRSCRNHWRKPQVAGVSARSRYRRWCAARACGCNATRTAACSTSSSSRSTRA